MILFYDQGFKNLFVENEDIDKLPIFKLYDYVSIDKEDKIPNISKAQKADYDYARNFVWCFKNNGSKRYSHSDISYVRTYFMNYIAYILRNQFLDGKGLTIIFAPCSTKKDYKKRWSMLSKVLSKITQAEDGYGYVKITKDRTPCHWHKGRTADNYQVSKEIKGKRCILVDDLTASGYTLEHLKDKIEANGGTVLSAIVIAKSEAIT